MAFSKFSAAAVKLHSLLPTHVLNNLFMYFGTDLIAGKLTNGCSSILSRSIYYFLNLHRSIVISSADIHSTCQSRNRQLLPFLCRTLATRLPLVTSSLLEEGRCPGVHTSHRLFPGSSAFLIICRHEPSSLSVR